MRAETGAKRRKAVRRAVASLCVAAVIAALIVTDLFFFPFELLRARAGAPEIPLRAR